MAFVGCCRLCSGCTNSDVEKVSKVFLLMNEAKIRVVGLAEWAVIDD